MTSTELDKANSKKGQKLVKSIFGKVETEVGYKDIAVPADFVPVPEHTTLYNDIIKTMDIKEERDGYVLSYTFQRNQRYNKAKNIFILTNFDTFVMGYNFTVENNMDGDWENYRTLVGKLSTKEYYYNESCDDNYWYPVEFGKPVSCWNRDERSKMWRAYTEAFHRREERCMPFEEKPEIKDGFRAIWDYQGLHATAREIEICEKLRTLLNRKAGDDAEIAKYAKRINNANFCYRDERHKVVFFSNGYSVIAGYRTDWVIHGAIMNITSEHHLECFINKHPWGQSQNVTTDASEQKYRVNDSFDEIEKKNAANIPLAA